MLVLAACSSAPENKIANSHWQDEQGNVFWFAPDTVYLDVNGQLMPMEAYQVGRDSLYYPRKPAAAYTFLEDSAGQQRLQIGASVFTRSLQ